MISGHERRFAERARWLPVYVTSRPLGGREVTGGSESAGRWAWQLDDRLDWEVVAGELAVFGIGVDRGESRSNVGRGEDPVDPGAVRRQRAEAVECGEQGSAGLGGLPGVRQGAVGDE